jgi:riboflavin kinase/FMN adenylyltransferase
LEEIGIENLVIHPFDEAFFTTNRRGVCKTKLVEKFHIQNLIIGHDHRFGRKQDC